MLIFHQNRQICLLCRIVSREILGLGGQSITEKFLSFPGKRKGGQNSITRNIKNTVLFGGLTELDNQNWTFKQIKIIVISVFLFSILRSYLMSHLKKLAGIIVHEKKAVLAGALFTILSWMMFFSKFKPFENRPSIIGTFNQIKQF